MPRLGPIKRRELIAGLIRLGFTGAYSGGNHRFMKRDALKLRIPNPHQSDISLPLLRRILQQAGVSETEWNLSDMLSPIVAQRPWRHKWREACVHVSVVTSQP